MRRLSAPPVRVRVPATTANLGPGFDAFGAALGLHLHASARYRENGEPRVVSTGEGADELPEGDENLLWRSFGALYTHVGETPPDLHVSVASDIPLERGLGSSSAAIVAGLGLARALVETGVGDPELVRLASEIEGHPDNVAPAVLGGLVSVTPDVDGLPTIRRVQPHTRLRLLAFVPDIRQQTVAARAALPESLTREDASTEAARAGHVLAGLAGVWPVAPLAAVDLLHEPARFAVMKATGQLVTALRRDGFHAWLSGAGPSVCVALPRRERARLTDGERIAVEHGFATRVLDWDLSGLVTTSATPGP